MPSSTCGDRFVKLKAHSIREGFEMEVNSLQRTCTDRQTIINDEYTAQGGTLDNLPPSVFNDTTNLVNVLPPADSIPDDPVAHESLLFDLRQRYQSKANLYIRPDPAPLPPVQAITNVSHLHQVALNTDALRIAAEQKERDLILAEKERVAALRREEQQHKEQHRLQAKLSQKEKARQAAALRKQKAEQEAAAQELAKEEANVDDDSSSDVMETSGSESEADLLARVSSSVLPFCRMTKSDRSKLIQRYNHLLPKGYSKQHCPKYIRLVANSKIYKRGSETSFLTQR